MLNKLLPIFVFFPLIGMNVERDISVESVVEAWKKTDIESEIMTAGLANYFRRTPTPELRTRVELLRDAEDLVLQRSYALMCLSYLAVTTDNPHELGRVLLGYHTGLGTNPEDPLYQAIVKRLQDILQRFSVEIPEETIDLEQEENEFFDEPKSYSWCLDNKITPCLNSTRRCIAAVIGLTIVIGGGVSALIALFLSK